MGARADFYVGRGTTAQWIGSIQFDGHPDTIMGRRKHPALPNKLARSKTSEAFVERLGDRMGDRDDFYAPPEPWPWPWEDSRMTDYAYAFDDGLMWVLTGEIEAPSWVPIADELHRRAAPSDDSGPIVITAEWLQGSVVNTYEVMKTVSSLVPRMWECSRKRGET